MIPSLLEATRTYWRKLDELEHSYQKGEVSLTEVNARVSTLMEELARECRLAFAYFWDSWRQWLALNKETVTSLLVLAVIAYVWLGPLQTFLF